MAVGFKSPGQYVEDALKKAKAQPHGIHTDVVDLNGALAEELLTRNTNNRKVSKANVRRYRKDAEHGAWSLNGQPIIVSSDGVLADGQHRLAAIVGTEFKIPTLMVFGVQPETRTTMDQGRARNAGDYITMLGEETGSIAGTMIRYIMAFETNKHADLKGLAKASAAEIIEFFKANEQKVRRSAELAAELREVARYHVAAPMLAFIHYLLSEQDPAKAETYVRQIAKGEGLNEEDPAYVVRAKLIALGRINGTKKAEIILSGWKPFLEGKPMKGIRVQGRLPGI
jgi:hypothetical protein